MSGRHRVSKEPHFGYSKTLSSDKVMRSQDRATLFQDSMARCDRKEVPPDRRQVRRRHATTFLQDTAARLRLSRPVTLRSLAQHTPYERYQIIQNDGLEQQAVGAERRMSSATQPEGPRGVADRDC
jgi:hypothetical protein